MTIDHVIAHKKITLNFVCAICMKIKCECVFIECDENGNEIVMTNEYITQVYNYSINNKWRDIFFQDIDDSMYHNKRLIYCLNQVLKGTHHVSLDVSFLETVCLHKCNQDLIMMLMNDFKINPNVNCIRNMIICDDINYEILFKFVELIPPDQSCMSAMLSKKSLFLIHFGFGFITLCIGMNIPFSNAMFSTILDKYEITFKKK